MSHENTKRNGLVCTIVFEGAMRHLGNSNRHFAKIKNLKTQKMV